MNDKFAHLVAPYGFKSFYSKYPEGYSIFEALLNWLDEVNKMIDTLNTTQAEWATLKEWINTELKNYAQDQLVAWLNDGTLEAVINETLFNSKLDVTDFNTFKTATEGSFDTLSAEVEGFTEQQDQLLKNIAGDMVQSNVFVGDIKGLRDGLSRGHVKMAVWGDSIATGGDYLTLADSFAQQYLTRLKDAFPTVQFEFRNYSLGGTTLAQAASESFLSDVHFTVDWADVTNTPWRQFIKWYAPDLLFIAFGMNPNADGASMTSFWYETIVQFLVDTPTSIVLMSNIMPKQEYAGVAYNQRYISARATREYAKYRNLSCIDNFNQYRMMVDGVDETKHYTIRYTDSDFTREDHFDKSTFKALNFEYSDNIELTDSNSWIMYLRENTTIELSKISIKLSGESAKTISLTTGVHLVKIKVVGASITVTIDQVEQYSTTQQFSNLIENNILVGYPVGSGTSSGRQVNVYHFGFANKKLTDEEVLGKYIPGDVGIKLPYGGNGVNHPSSLGFNYLYTPLIIDFALQAKRPLEKMTINKTFDLTFAVSGVMKYANLSDEKKFPLANGMLVDPNGFVYTLNKEERFNVAADTSKLGPTEFFCKRTGGVLQIIIKASEPTGTWKFTTWQYVN